MCEMRQSHAYLTRLLDRLIVIISGTHHEHLWVAAILRGYQSEVCALKGQSSTILHPSNLQNLEV